MILKYGSWLTDDLTMATEKKVILQNGNLLAFNPRYINNTYGVLINYPEKEITVHYEIVCRYCGYINDYHFLFSLDRKQVFINNKVPEMKLYQMADDMAKAFYPVELCISNTEKVIKKIENYTEIVERCQQAYNQIANGYGGDLASTFSQQFKKQYSNPNILKDRFQNELFYKLFFFPLYKRYTPQLTAVSAFSFPFDMDSEDPLLQISHQISPDYTYDDKIMVNLNSTALPAENTSAENNDTSFEACYQLYANDYTISSITGKAICNNAMGEKSTMEFEMYHLDAETRVKPVVTLSKPVESIPGTRSIIVESAEVKKVRSFWGIFN